MSINGAVMSCIGKTEDFTLKIEGLPQVMQLSATVYSGLASDRLNIGSQLLQRIAKATGSPPKLVSEEDKVILEFKGHQSELIHSLECDASPVSAPQPASPGHPVQPVPPPQPPDDPSKVTKTPVTE